MKLERCEERLVFSALPALDISHHLFNDAFTSLDGSVGPTELEPSPSVPVSNVALQPLTSAAHDQTGWTDVQRLFGLRGEHQTVAVIDSGIAWDHLALGKGFGPGYRVVGGWDFAENDAKPYDDAPAGFHGTHVSGIIGADDPTRSGVAPGVDLVALRVFDDAGKGQMAWTESALRWVHQNRTTFASPITTVNLSLGSSWNSGTVPTWGILEEELLQLQQDGIVVVASAGNSFQQYKTPGLSYPGASPYVIPVASIDSNGTLSDFSQRNERVLAAPGRQILSTVPDHVLGSDGIFNDWSTANGTSMAAPYVSGSSVLVREAMEMVGRASITPQEIYQWMSDTSDSVWDSVTNASYDRLNLGRAIQSLLPSDNVGDNWSNANPIELQNSFSTNGWLNTLGDRDAFRFTASSDGALNVAAQSSWLQGSTWSLWMDGQSVTMADPTTAHLNLQAGHSYAIALSDTDQIGSYALQWNFTPSNHSNGDGSSEGRGNNQGAVPTDLGPIDYREISNASGQAYSFEASHDGKLSIIIQAGQAKNGVLEIQNSQGTLVRDTTIENGQWRLDVEATEGSKWIVRTPSTVGSVAELILANVIQQNGSTLNVVGTANADSLEVDAAQGLHLQFGKVSYAFGETTITNLNVDLESGSDSIHVRGSSLAEKVELRPEHSTIENQRIAFDLQSIEQIDFSGGGGPDRVYLYGSIADDTLTAHPRDVELVGAGFRFHVDQVERTYVNAEQGGQDFAYLYDSVGNDRLSVRPQFSSMSGNDFFNYASGIERVYAYSNTGGIDSAVLYDSVANDTFFTSGDIASMVGSGFFSYTRYFESVEAISSTGGKDIASVYATERNSLLVGSDFSGYQDTSWSRIARGFSSAKTFIDSQLIETKSFGSLATLQIDITSAIYSDIALANATIASAVVHDENRTALPMIADSTRSSAQVDPIDLETRLLSEAQTLMGALHIELNVESTNLTENKPLNLIRLDDESCNLIDDLDWLDLHRERQLVNEIFAQHGRDA